MKNCSKCKILKAFEEFSQHRGRKDGLQRRCKTCVRGFYLKNKTQIASQHKIYNLKHKKELVLRGKTYYLENKERIAVRNKNYYLKNKEKVAEQSKKYRSEHRAQLAIQKKDYNLKHKKQMALHSKNRKKIDIQYRITTNLRSRIWKAIKINLKSGSAVRDLGCTIPELKFYLEGQFQDGMTWANWSMEGWHIDHKIPLTFFDLTNRAQFLQAAHYTNLQPMWAKDNIKKSNKIAGDLTFTNC